VSIWHTIIFNIKTILVLTLIISCLSGCSVAKKETVEEPLKKIGEYLYEVSYTEDFDWSKAISPDLSQFVCSGIQNGQYRGRNYDWVYSDVGICVVHASANDTRPHASVGVADLSYIPEIFETKDYSCVPFYVVDGINDAGVCIQANVVPGEDSNLIVHTATDADDLQTIGVVRYVLDYAGSVKEAIELLEKKDIYPEIAEEENLHWMISGPTSDTDQTFKTVIIEVHCDGLRVVENFIDDKPIITNFDVSNFDGSLESIGFGSGYERWKILDEYYDQANSVMGTFDLMEKVYYSKLYDLYLDDFWYSEYNWSDLSIMYEEDELKALLGEEKFNYYMNNYGGVYYDSGLYDGEKALYGDTEKSGIIKPAVEYYDECYKTQNKEEGILWITIHTSVYDLVNKTLDIQVHESQEVLHFTID